MISLQLTQDESRNVTTCVTGGGRIDLCYPLVVGCQSAHHYVHDFDSLCRRGLSMVYLALV